MRQRPDGEEDGVNFEEWEAGVPPEVRKDALWRVKAYRVALFLSELAWEDGSVLAKDVRTARIAGQMLRAVGSIGANIAEGYSRRSRKDQARLYEYALGSAREARHWYLQVQPLLGADVVSHRTKILTAIIQLLLAMIPNQRDTSHTPRT